MDGSAGFSGDVVTLLAKLLDEGRISAPLLYSCGPAAMVRALVERTGGRFKSHHTSLEAVMACGVGACRGCTVPLREEGRIVFKAVCDDGTVFRASDIAWEEWW
jgi:dihydroorotate dehydrogenase electron transfer subunit